MNNTIQNLLAVDIGQFSPISNTDAYSDVDTLANGKIVEILNYFIGFSAVVAVAMIIVSGYLFITAAGDQEKIEKAQGTITAAVVGMIVVFVARLIVMFVLSIIDGA